MRDRMERIVILPFSVGCISDSSVAVAVQHHRRSNLRAVTNSVGCISDSSVAAAVQHHRRSKLPADTNSSAITTGIRQEDEESMKNSFKFLALSKPDISTGLHRLSKSLKTFSQFFVYKEDEEEVKSDHMEIGFPTEVKHVTHIGWEGPFTTDPGKGWDELISPELLTLPSIPLKPAQAGSSLVHKLAST